MADRHPGEDIDALTGLPLFNRALADIPRLIRTQNPGDILGLTSIAIAPAPVLYRLTQEANQELRRLATARLTAVLRPQDRLYVLGPWEWLVVLPSLLSPAPLTLAMLRLHGTLHEPFDSRDGDTLMLDCHCGGALWPTHGEDPIHLAQSARIARLHAEDTGSGIEVYEPGHERGSTTQRFPSLASALAGGSDHPPRLYLQPQIELATGRCIAAEALLRWPISESEFAAPHHVIAAIQKQGLHHTFTRWLFNQAMQIIKQLDASKVPISLSVNLSAHDLLDVELPDLLHQALATWEIPAHRLLLEITETSMVEESQQVEDVLNGLRQLGVALAIDDFGTAYAGMSYLQRLPIEEVKIDQGFVQQAVHSERNREIVSSVTQLAQRLQLRAVAEGVEDEATAQLLRDLGCPYAQGYHYAKPLALDAFITWFHRQRPGEPGAVCGTSAPPPINADRPAD